ncbi:hypothetical protein [Oceanobacillus salinisoli]|uniref:hypothetical protein n=1 Tax=Oceanobacillus salinisoli TaxID=2678611 RepID=UPI0018CC05A7|nr:hypothetical protein [Oceanobacillus salinisoli]
MDRKSGKKNKNEELTLAKKYKFYGLDAEDSLQSVSFATNENHYLNESNESFTENDIKE